MRTRLAAAAIAVVLGGGTAQAQPEVYSWTGMGVNVPGSSKCNAYQMTIDVTVDGNAIKGRFQQQGRPERHFEATKNATGVIKTTAVVGGGNTMEVTLTMTGKEQRILLDGYCKFEGKLTKK